MLKNANTSITLPNLNYKNQYHQKHKQKIIMCESGPINKLVGARGDFFAGSKPKPGVIDVLSQNDC